MNLRGKTILISAVSYGGLFIMLGMLVGSMVLRVFSETEEREAQRNVERILVALEHETDQLGRYLQTFSACDFSSRSFADTALAGLGLNVLVCLDATGGVVQATGFDRGCRTRLPDDLWPLLAPDGVLHGHQMPVDVQCGIVSLQRCPLLFAAHLGCQKQEGHGRYSALVLGRYLDDATVRRIADVSLSSFTIVPHGMVSNTVVPERFWIHALASTSLVARGTLKNLPTMPGLTIQVAMPRTTWRHGLATVCYVLMALMATGLLFALVNLLGLERLVLRGMSRLSTHVARIADQQDLSASMPVAGDDEIDRLAASINGMVAALADARNFQQIETERVLRYHAALVQIARTEMRDSAAMRARMLEKAADTIEVERVGFWRFDPAGAKAICENTYLRSAQRHESGTILRESDYPVYFAAMEQQHTIAADDAVRDPRTAEFGIGYLVPLGITSMMDVPVRLHGKLAGIVCFEHIGAPRHWCAAEQEFAWSVADLLALSLETADRARAEHALRESEERLALAQRFAHVGTWDWDIATDIEIWSPTLKAIYGMPDDGMPVSSDLFRELIHPDDQARVAASWNACVQHGKEYNIEYRIVQPCGAVRWIAARGNVVRDADGGALRMLGITMDITDRKAAERALAAETEQLAVTLRSIADAVITTDTGGRILLLNKAAERLAGWPAAEACGRPLREVLVLLNERTRTPCDDPVASVLRAGAVVSLDEHCILVARDGMERIVENSGAPIRDQESRTVGAVIVFRDITAKRVMDEEMSKAQKLESIGILAGGIAHDFNNILTVILGNISLARLQSDLPHTTDERLLDAENAVKQAMGLTHQLLTFSRGGQPVRKVVSIAALLRDTVSFACRGSNAKYDVDIEDGLWPAFADSGQIGQVINNLVINAVHAMSDGGTIDVRARNVVVGANDASVVKPGRYVKFSISDQGVGIPREHLPRIFDPYFTTKQKGHGLGLAVSYSIVRNHQGGIQVDSEPGLGTTFHIFLPAEEMEQPLQPARKRTEGGSGHILLMDDEIVILKTTGALLARLGYTVETAMDGTEAVAKFRTAREKGGAFDAIILDLTIQGGLGGKETAQKLLALDPKARIIASSGYSTASIIIEYRAYGFAGALQKPYSLNELQDTMRTVLAGQQNGSDAPRTTMASP